MKGKKVLNRAATVAKRLRPGKSMLVGALLSVVSVAAMAAGDFSNLTGLTDINAVPDGVVTAKPAL